MTYHVFYGRAQAFGSWALDPGANLAAAIRYLRERDRRPWGRFGDGKAYVGCLSNREIDALGAPPETGSGAGAPAPDG